MSVALNVRVVSFGPFRLHPVQRLLLEDGMSLSVGSRAMDVLISLVDRAGEVVSKEELMAQVWPNMTVAESNLKVQISTLRRALSDGQGENRYILTVPGRGYSFVAPIAWTYGESAAPSLAFDHQCCRSFNQADDPERHDWHSLSGNS